MGLPGILARAIGRDIEQIYLGSNKGVLADVDLLQRITEASRACVREFVRDRTGGWPLARTLLSRDAGLERNQHKSVLLYHLVIWGACYYTI